MASFHCVVPPLLHHRECAHPHISYARVSLRSLLTHIYHRSCSIEALICTKNNCSTRWRKHRLMMAGFRCGLTIGRLFKKPVRPEKNQVGSNPMRRDNIHRHSWNSHSRSLPLSLLFLGSGGLPSLWELTIQPVAVFWGVPLCDAFYSPSLCNSTRPASDSFQFSLWNTLLAFVECLGRYYSFYGPMFASMYLPYLLA